MKKLFSLFTALLFWGSMSVVQATNYYYRGNQNGWSTTLMTTSSDGFYAYFSANSYSNNGNSNNNFKISTTTDSWDYNSGYVTRGFNGTDIKNTSGNKSIGFDWDGDNICVYCTSDFYILIYFPNTDINTTNKPIICASTTLPDNTPTYTVVGTVPGLNWDQASSTNDMTENNGIYTLLLENVELAANTYEYKMVKNHSWDVSYPQSGNADFSITEAGIYNVTFTLNLSASPEYSVTPVLIQPAVVIPSVKLYGTFADGTNWAETAKFAIAGNNESASLTLSNLPAGDYQFKVLVGSSYLGNGHTFHRDYTGASNIGTGENMTLEADVTGDYTFTWTYENNALNIGFPAEPTPEYVEVKFFAPRDETNKWEHVYAYSYKGSRVFSEPWPGTEITSTKEAGWYTVSVRKGSNLIFHDNAGMQTDDIENIQEAACYQPTAINYGEDPKKVTLAIENDCEITYYIAGSTALVGGAVDFDTNAALDDNNQIVFHDVEPGTYAFKINNGTWAWSIAGEDHLKEGECSSIATTVGVGDLGFAIVEKQDITITYYPETQEICLGAVTVQTLPEIAIEQIGGKFIIDAKGDTAVFSRGNLQYHYGLNRWYCAEHQYDFLGEEANLQFGKEGYTGAIDLFGWSNSDSNYGRMLSNNDADYMNSTFVDWGGLFTGDKTWSTFNTSQMNYVIAHQKWTTLTLDPTPEDDENGDEIRGLVLFPYDWVMPAGYEQIHYSLHDWNDEQGFADNTILPSAWDALEAAGAVFMPMAGARAGYWGCTWNGDHENTNPAAWNPAAANSFDHVDNIGWYGYYWLSTPDSRSNYQHCANYLIFLGWGEGPTLADDDDIYYPPQVWSREKRRGNSVRLVNIIPRQYTVTYTAGEGEGTVPTDENKYLDGAAVTLAAATGLSKEGYKFVGWKFKGQVYNDSYTVNNVLANEEIVFEAQWELDWTEVRNGLTEGWYYTMCLDKAVTAVKGGTIWKVVSKSHNGVNPDIILEEVDGTLDAGRPYIFNATAAELEVIYTGDAVLAPVTEDNNGLIGSFSQASITPNTTNYIIYNNALYYVNSDNVYVGANRAYLDMTGVPAYSSEPQQGSAPRRRVVMTVHGEQTATGMENVQGDNVQCTKILINGQLFILRGEQLYDATGRIVK